MGHSKRKGRGFTLIEVMIVIVVVALLMTVALPAYQQQVLKSKRALGKGELLKILAEQEQYFVNNRSYALTLADLGHTNPYAIDADGNEVATGDSARIYTIQLDSASATAFNIQAVPQLGQADDTLCKTLQITSTGIKTESGTATAAECW